MNRILFVLRTFNDIDHIIPKDKKQTHVKGWKDQPNATQYNESISFKDKIKTIDLLKENAILGFITSRYFIEATYANKLRQFILDKCEIKIIIERKSLKDFSTSIKDGRYKEQKIRNFMFSQARE